MGDTPANGTTPTGTTSPAPTTPGGSATLPQAGTPATPQAGQPQPAQPSADGNNGNSNTGDGNEVMTLAEARKLRQENASLRDRVKAVDDAAEAERLAKLDELGKTQAKLQKAEATAATYREVIGQLATQLEATKLGIVDPDVAATLISPSLHFGDDGKPTNAADLLKDLIKTKPYLKTPDAPAQPPTPKPANNGPANPGSQGAPTGATQPGINWKNPPRLGQKDIWNKNQ